MKLRLALTISGAVSLGPYEAGALAALIVAVRELCQGDDPPVRVDAIGGASAGSITGMLAARCLLEGIDPVHVMREVWVTRASFDAMRSTATDSLLSVQSFEGTAADLIDPRDALGRPTHRVGVHQSLPIRLEVALACLRGLEYRVPSLSRRTPVQASTHLDWATFTFRPGQRFEELVEPKGASALDAAMASAANPFAFPPRLLDRREHEELYRRRGIVNFPRSGQLWYTDGGTLEREPLTRTIALVNELDRGITGDVRRMQLLVHPHPTGAPTGDAWADPATPPTWLGTLRRSQDLQRTQSLYDDLLHLEELNTRIGWANRLVGELEPVLEELAPQHESTLRDALCRALAKIEGERRALRAHETGAAEAAAVPVDEGRPTVELLREAIERVAAIAGKRPIALEAISPQVLPEAKDTPIIRMLAGEFLFHFGGFFDERLRQSDFDLGYRSTVEWLRAGGLRDHGLAVDLDEQALASAETAYRPRQTWRRMGSADIGSLGWDTRLDVARVVAHLLRLVVHDLRHARPQS